MRARFGAARVAVTGWACGALGGGAVGVAAESGAVTRTLLGLVRDDLDERDLADRVCRACVDGLDVDGAALSLLTGSESRVTLAATNSVARLLEELQFTLNEGVCMEAAVTGRPVLVPDLHDPGQGARWPLFAAAVAERAAVSALFALPLQWGAINLGVLHLYRAAPGPLGEEQWRDAVAASDTAALMMLDQRTDPGPGTVGEATLDAGPAGADLVGSTGSWLDEAAGGRAEIHQATGMVTVQLGVKATDALARMRGYAFSHQQLLIEVARDVVARRLVFTEEMS